MEKDFETVLLFDVYSELLTPKQKKLCDMYYNQDYSLSEIAEIENTTRQAARDGIDKAREKLKRLEECLQLKGKRALTRQVISEVSDLAELKKTIRDIWEIDDGV